jgi:hypothetical protein
MADIALKMKTTIFRKFILGAVILPAIFFIGALPSNSQTEPPPPPGAPAATADDSAQANTPASLPQDIPPGSPLAQVVQMAQAGVNENVIASYINNSGAAFNLTSDQIIYLKDIGLPDDAVTAMMQRDQQLGATSAAQSPPPAATDETATEPPAEVTQNYFYDTLSPYGDWVNVEGYGLCWRPTVVIYDSSWQPYCDHGHWIYTDAGWYWLSDYSWGACVFHYGRWFHDPRRGWCWWPDTVWAPSWVTWRYTSDYCGWAPLPPRAVYREGSGFFYNGMAVSAGFNFGLSANFFTFVPTRDFCDPHPRRYRIARAQAAQIYNRTIIINNFNADGRSHAIINAGISPQRITAVTRTEIHPVAIRETSAPVARGEQFGRDGQTLVVNRPHFDANAAAALNSGIRPRREMTAGQNPQRSIIVNGNWNNSNPRPVAPAQNNFSQPNRNLSIPQTQPVAPVVRNPQEQSPRPPESNGNPSSFNNSAPHGEPWQNRSIPPSSSAAFRNSSPPAAGSQPQQGQSKDKQGDTSSFNDSAPHGEAWQNRSIPPSSSAAFRNSSPPAAGSQPQQEQNKEKDKDKQDH